MTSESAPTISRTFFERHVAQIGDVSPQSPSRMHGLTKSFTTLDFAEPCARLGAFLVSNVNKSGQLKTVYTWRSQEEKAFGLVGRTVPLYPATSPAKSMMPKHFKWDDNFPLWHDTCFTTYDIRPPSH